MADLENFKFVDAKGPGVTISVPTVPATDLFNRFDTAEAYAGIKAEMLTASMTEYGVMNAVSLNMDKVMRYGDPYMHIARAADETKGQAVEFLNKRARVSTHAFIARPGIQIKSYSSGRLLIFGWYAIAGFTAKDVFEADYKKAERCCDCCRK